MKTNVLSAFALCMLLSVSAYAQTNTTAADREAGRQVREQKIERSKGELKEMGQDVKKEAKVVGKAVSTEAKKVGRAVDTKVQERKARRAAKRDSL